MLLPFPMNSTNIVTNIGSDGLFLLSLTEGLLYNETSQTHRHPLVTLFVEHILSISQRYVVSNAGQGTNSMIERWETDMKDI